MAISKTVYVIISGKKNVQCYERILMKFCEEMGRGPKRNRLDFGGDPICFVDLESIIFQDSRYVTN